MTTGLTDALKSRGLAGLIHAGLWVLLVLAINGMGGRMPEFRESDSFNTPPQSPVPVASMERLFAPGVWPKSPTNSLNPFFTRHFVPQPAPAVPQPTTRKFELTYQGFYQSTDAPKRALIKVGEQF